MNNQCIAYISDENYFFPTAVSALQARAHTYPTTDVVIVATENFKYIADAQTFCDSHGIRLIDASVLLSKKFAGLNAQSFSHRVSISAMGRLLLSDVLPAQYQQVIYIDGDTQIASSLNALEDLHAAPGKLLAALDYVSVLERLNGAEQSTVFNSGVLKFDRRQWIGPAAFDHYVANGGELHDQGALNAVVGDALLLISNRWNFPKQFLHLLGADRPAIIHFMAHPKPWDGRFFPWTTAESDVYRRALKGNPSLKPFVSKISLPRYCVYKMRSWRDELKFRLHLGNLRWHERNIRKVLSS
jgi:lipopolysaccharide biosynthesis glycosyltransferase